MTDPRPTGWEGADRWFASEGGGEPAPQPPSCETCGAELEADQTYCLECGAPTPLAPRLRRGTRGAAMLAGAMVVLGLGAGALAFAVVEDDGAGPVSSGVPVPAPVAPTDLTTPTVATATVTVPTTGTLPPDTSFTTPTVPTTDAGTTPGVTDTTGFETVTGPATLPTTTAETATSTEAPPPTTEETTGLSDWPAGTSAWTAILSSVRSEVDARAAKTRVAASGEPAGVLFSSDFPPLRAGFWVVYSGRYGSRGSAVAQAGRLQPDFPGAYARRIEG